MKTFVLNKTACFKLNKTNVYNPEIVSPNLLTQSMSTDTKNSKHRCAQTYRCAIICTCLRYLLLSIASNTLGWCNMGVSWLFSPTTEHQLIRPNKEILVHKSHICSLLETNQD